jgi:hypothetical protein
MTRKYASSSKAQQMIHKNMMSLFARFRVVLIQSSEIDGCADLGH